MNHGKHKTVQVGIITVSLAKKHFTVQKFFSFEIALFFHIGRFFFRRQQSQYNHNR